MVLLIDGGNEHNEPHAFISSIINLINKISVGHLKIVLSWRVSILSDLPSVEIGNIDILYDAGKREEHLLLAKNAYLLKGLNKIELEGAWDFYSSHPSKLYKPSFSFRDLLAFDSLLVDELSNPLLLRLFMELYKGKPLPNASKGFINLWQKWWEQLQKNT